MDTGREGGTQRLQPDGSWDLIMPMNTQTLVPGTRSKKSLTSLPSSAAAHDVHRALSADGALIIEDLLDEQTVNQINAELDTALSGPQLGMQDDKVVGQSRRLNATLRHSPTMVKNVVAHPVLIDAAESVLLDHSDTLQLVSVASEVVPGEDSQMLHRDDWNWGHVKGRSHPLSIFSIIALDEFTATNGATRIVLDSHRWEDAYAAATNKSAWRKRHLRRDLVSQGKNTIIWQCQR